MTHPPFHPARDKRAWILLWIFAGAVIVCKMAGDALPPPDILPVQFFGGKYPFKLQNSDFSSGSFFTAAVQFLQRDSAGILTADGLLMLISFRLLLALAAAGTLWSVLHLTNRFFDRQTALTAGWLMTGCCAFTAGRILMLPVLISMLSVVAFFSAGGNGRFYRFWTAFFAGIWLGGPWVQGGLLLFLMPFCFVDRVRKRICCWQQFPAVLTGAAFYVLLALAAAVVDDGPEMLSWETFLQTDNWNLRESVIRPKLEETGQIKDLWFCSLVPFFALELAAIWGSILYWKKLPGMVRGSGIGLILSLVLWMICPDTAIGPVFLLPLGVLFFAPVLNSDALAPCKKQVFRGTHQLALLVPAVLFSSLCFAAAGQTLFQLPLWGGNAFLVAGCGALGLLLMLWDELRPGAVSRWSGLPKELAAQVICLALTSAILYCGILPKIAGNGF